MRTAIGLCQRPADRRAAAAVVFLASGSALLGVAVYGFGAAVFDER